MNSKIFQEPLLSHIREVVRNHDLAKFGDVLTNFIYSLARTKTTGNPCGIRVYDKVLAEAMRKTNLRSLLPSSISSGEIGDGAEALIGYVYLKKLYSIEKMVDVLVKDLLPLTKEEHSKKLEKELMVNAFVSLLKELTIKIEKIRIK
jgi:hypothetical protein